MSFTDRARRFLSYNLNQDFIKAATGPYLFTVSGNKYLDLTNPHNLFGYNNPYLTRDYAEFRGLPVLASPCFLEVDLAERLREFFPWVQCWVFGTQEMSVPLGCVREDYTAFRDEGFSLSRRYNQEPDILHLSPSMANGLNCTALGFKSPPKPATLSQIPVRPGAIATALSQAMLIRTNHNYHWSTLTEGAKNFFGDLSGYASKLANGGFRFESCGAESVTKIVGDRVAFRCFQREAQGYGILFSETVTAVGYAHLPYLDNALHACRDILIKMH